MAKKIEADIISGLRRVITERTFEYLGDNVGVALCLSDSPSRDTRAFTTVGELLSLIRPDAPAETT